MIHQGKYSLTSKEELILVQPTDPTLLMSLPGYAAHANSAAGAMRHMTLTRGPRVSDASIKSFQAPRYAGGSTNTLP